MKDTLKAGLTVTQHIRVDAGRTIGFMGDEGRVYSTPSMILDMEQTCRKFLLEHIDEGQDSVGVRVDVSHVAACPLDTDVEVTATITEIDRRRVTFSVLTRDPIEDVGRGTHVRFITDKAESRKRVAAKIAKLKELAGR
jgi:fluoroacetyl-CoA thioesterase